ncbi:MAG: PAS domain S-box protein [Bryobacterales bacterium]|nr:PAS domain S-box protein [Bryobacterales bacterium]
MTILNVEDDVATRYARTRILRKAGYDVKEAATGQEALRVSAAERPALILLDVKLPDLNGLEVCRRLKDNPTTARIPVLQISAVAVSELDRLQGLGAGADTYITEPVDAEGLVAAVSALLEAKGQDAHSAGERTLLHGLRRGTGDVTRSDRMFRALLDAAPDAMVIIESNGKIVLVNSKTERLFGYARHEMIGQPVEMLMPPRFRSGHTGLRQSFLQDPRPRPMGVGLELFARRKDGSEFPVEISLSPLKTEEGVLVTSVVRDITERKEAEERIRALNAELETRVSQRTAELERSNEDLQQFAYVASHDLKEPLRTVTSYAQLLEQRYRNQLSPEAADILEYIVDGVRRMNALLDDLLGYSRTIGPYQPAPAARVELENVARLAISNLDAAIRESNAEVSFQALPVIEADSAQMLQLLQNLIGNAIKYRGPEPPRVYVSAERRGENWVISVKDNGIGIEPRYADRVFLPFKRLHGGEYPGTGIGLAICKKIVERHGGFIWVESQPGAGSTFYFTLPAAGADSSTTTS